jgi:hypothetical protein
MAGSLPPDAGAQHGGTRRAGINRKCSARFYGAGGRTSSCTNGGPATEGGAIVAAHDGYAPLMHTRRVELDARTGRLDVEDVLTGDGVHTACVHWVFGEGCGVLRDESDVLHITLPDGRVMRMSIAIDGIVDEQRGGEGLRRVAQPTLPRSKSRCGACRDAVRSAARQ